MTDSAHIGQWEGDGQDLSGSASGTLVYSWCVGEALVHKQDQTLSVEGVEDVNHCRLTVHLPLATFSCYFYLTGCRRCND